MKRYGSSFVQNLLAEMEKKDKNINTEMKKAKFQRFSFEFLNIYLLNSDPM